MAADKAAAVAATGAHLLLSQDSGCLMNIDGTARKAGLGFGVQHIAEFIWQRTNGHGAAPHGKAMKRFFHRND
jgi:L-lactate dehydrogenase complex protein LldE